MYPAETLVTSADVRKPPSRCCCCFATPRKAGHKGRNADTRLSAPQTREGSGLIALHVRDQGDHHGMFVESIATMLGKRSLRRTFPGLRIANNTVAYESAAASAKIDALSTDNDPEIDFVLAILSSTDGGKSWPRCGPMQRDEVFEDPSVMRFGTHPDPLPRAACAWSAAATRSEANTHRPPLLAIEKLASRDIRSGAGVPVDLCLNVRLRRRTENRIDSRPDVARVPLSISTNPPRGLSPKRIASASVADPRLWLRKKDRAVCAVEELRTPRHTIWVRPGLCWRWRWRVVRADYWVGSCEEGWKGSCHHCCHNDQYS